MSCVLSKTFRMKLTLKSEILLLKIEPLFFQDELSFHSLEISKNLENMCISIHFLRIHMNPALFLVIP